MSKVYFLFLLQVQRVMMITTRHLRVRMKNSKWRKVAKKKKRGKSPRMCKANTPLPPKRKNQLQRHQSQNHIQQVGYLFILSWNQIWVSFYSQLWFIWYWGELPCLPASSTPVRSPPTAKVAPKRPALSSVACTPRPASSLSPAAGRMPKWTPPGSQ